MPLEDMTLSMNSEDMLKVSEGGMRIEDRSGQLTRERSKQ